MSNISKCIVRGKGFITRPPCDVCGATLNVGGNDPKNADPCLGILPGVKYACCGHGKGWDATWQQPDDWPKVLHLRDPIKDSVNSYIVFDNGITIRGFDRIEYFDDPQFDEFHIEEMRGHCAGLVGQMGFGA